VIFSLLVEDLSTAALTLAAFASLPTVDRMLIRRLVVVPRTTRADWDFVNDQANAMSNQPGSEPH
jgi:hypothetical protein